MDTAAEKISRPIEILLVEDSLGDVRLTVEAFKEGKVKNNLHVAHDGIEGIEFLQDDSTLMPDIILLDLNMPRMDGREFLAKIKSDERFKLIPICVLTTSDSEIDVKDAYSLYANSYITKPVNIDHFINIVRSIENFWLSVVRLPPVTP